MENKKDEAQEKSQKVQMDDVKNQDSNTEKNVENEKQNSEPIKIPSQIRGVDNIVYESEKLWLRTDDTTDATRFFFQFRIS